MNPGLHLFKFEARERMKSEPEPILLFIDKVADKQTLCGTYQIQNPDCVGDFAGTDGTNGTSRAVKLVLRSSRCKGWKEYAYRQMRR